MSAAEVGSAPKSPTASKPAKAAKAAKASKVSKSSKSSDVGDRVIALRDEGKSFAAIAMALDLGRSLDAFGAFVAAVALRTPAEQTTLRADESGRLDALEQRTRRKSDPKDLERKLAAIGQLRKRLAAS